MLIVFKNKSVKEYHLRTMEIRNNIKKSKTWLGGDIVNKGNESSNDCMLLQETKRSASS